MATGEIEIELLFLPTSLGHRELFPLHVQRVISTAVQVTDDFIARTGGCVCLSGLISVRVVVTFILFFENIRVKEIWEEAIERFDGVMLGAVRWYPCIFATCEANSILPADPQGQA